MGDDRIEIRGLRGLGHHGANPGEQDVAQPFEVDLDVYCALGAAARSDDLGDTVDYSALCVAVLAVIEDERFALLEALASRIADLVLSVDGVIGVGVALRKVRPPVPVALETVGVRLSRGRPA